LCLIPGWCSVKIRHANSLHLASFPFTPDKFTIISHVLLTVALSLALFFPSKH
jgi:hypothetical protein